MAKFPDSEKKLVRLIESTVYGIEYDATLRFVAQAKKNVAETLDSPMLKELVEEIDTAAALERCAITSALEGEAKKFVETGSVNSANNDTAPSMVSISTAPWLSTAPDTTHWRNVARQRLNETTKLISDSGSSEAELTASLSTFEHSKVVGDATGHCLVLFDVNLAQESQTAPHLRQPPFRKEQVARLFDTILAVRNPTNPTGSKMQVGTWCYLLLY